MSGHNSQAYEFLLLFLFCFEIIMLFLIQIDGEIITLEKTCF